MEGHRGVDRLMRHSGWYQDNIIFFQGIGNAVKGVRNSGIQRNHNFIKRGVDMGKAHMIMGCLPSVIVYVIIQIFSQLLIIMEYPFSNSSSE